MLKKNSIHIFHEKIRVMTGKVRPFALWIVPVSFLGLFLMSALFPTIPREGDAFGCWFEYLRNWRNEGLAVAVKLADASGRFFGYPGLLFIIDDVTSFDFFQTLAAARLLTILFTFLAIYLFLKVLEFESWLAAVTTCLIISVPTFLTSITLNTQDSLKPALFLLSALMVIKIDRQKKRFTFYNFAFVFLCGGLISLRSIEVLPLFGFIIAYFCISRGFLKGMLIGLTYSLVPFVLAVGVHIYGHQQVGHWSFSAVNASPPQLWIKLAVDFVGGEFSNITHFMVLCIANLLNKVGYFIESFASPNGVISMLDVNKFFPGLQNPTYARIFVTYPLVIILSIGTFAYLIFMGKRTNAVSYGLICAAVVSAGFYTYGLNHFEQRYWLIVFICLVIVVANHIRIQNVGTAGLAFMLILLLSGSLTIKRLTDAWQSEKSDRQSIQNWHQLIDSICSRSKTVQVEYEYYVWSSFRYIASERCKDLEITFYRAGNEVKNIPILSNESLRLAWTSGNKIIGF